MTGRLRTPLTSKEKALEWLFNQGVSTVLLFAILAAGCYALKYLVPQHLQAIQNGYKQQQADFTNALEQERIHSEKSLDRTIESFERSQERLIKATESKEDAHNKVGAVN